MKTIRLLLLTPFFLLGTLSGYAQQAPPVLPQQQPKPQPPPPPPLQPQPKPQPPPPLLKESPAADLDENIKMTGKAQGQLSAERDVYRMRMLSEFLKSVDAFGTTSHDITAFASKPSIDNKEKSQIEKKAKDIEAELNVMLKYVLDGAKPPELTSAVDYNSQTLHERIGILKYSADWISMKMKNSYARSRPVPIDAKETVALIQVLQSVKILSRSLRR